MPNYCAIFSFVEQNDVVIIIIRLYCKYGKKEGHLHQARQTLIAGQSRKEKIQLYGVLFLDNDEEEASSCKSKSIIEFGGEDGEEKEAHG